MGNGGVPDGSPINFTSFNKVVIDGIDFDGKSLDIAPDFPAGRIEITCNYELQLYNERGWS
ncbi:hypothetical protein J4731_23675 [Providencia rettgeri]|nr:hypothetical protein [Providencia rettgeri]